MSFEVRVFFRHASSNLHIDTSESRVYHLVSSLCIFAKSLVVALSFISEHLIEEMFSFHGVFISLCTFDQFCTHFCFKKYTTFLAFVLAFELRNNHFISEAFFWPSCSYVLFFRDLLLTLVVHFRWQSYAWMFSMRALQPYDAKYGLFGCLLQISWIDGMPSKFAISYDVETSRLSRSTYLCKWC